jgi:hypothetical protein
MRSMAKIPPWSEYPYREISGISPQCVQCVPYYRYAKGQLQLIGYQEEYQNLKCSSGHAARAVQATTCMWDPCGDWGRIRRDTASPSLGFKSASSTDFCMNKTHLTARINLATNRQRGKLIFTLLENIRLMVVIALGAVMWSLQ